MTGDVSAFYDDLTSSYHFIFADWGASVRRQAGILDAPHRAADVAARHRFSHVSVTSPAASAVRLTAPAGQSPSPRLNTWCYRGPRSACPAACATASMMCE